MHLHLDIKETQKQKLAEGIISTLAFFDLYSLPVSSKKIFELLFGVKASLADVNDMLNFLVMRGHMVREGSLFALKKWDADKYNANHLELNKKWQKIGKYFFWLSILPFVRQISVINSLALGTADADSDIDFFVVTKESRLYFVRSIIIVLFRVLGVYKTRQRIKDRFCFGFFVSQKNLNLHSLLLKPEDPYFIFWLASMKPILGKDEYRNFAAKNSWVKNYFPNFDEADRLNTITKPGLLIRSIKLILELVLWLPASIFEPILRNIHIKHTFRLAENNTAKSTTVANAQMLKLHGYDVRADIAARYLELLNTLG